MKERQTRLKSAVREIVTELLRSGLKHPALQSGALITLSDVHVSPDLGSVTLYVSVLGGELAPVVTALEQSRGYLQSAIAKRLGMKRAPRLKIASHEQLEAAARLDSLFSEIEKEREAKRLAEAAEAAALAVSENAAATKPSDGSDDQSDSAGVGTVRPGPQ